jgi:hypothetical protein
MPIDPPYCSAGPAASSAYERAPTPGRLGNGRRGPEGRPSRPGEADAVALASQGDGVAPARPGRARTGDSGVLCCGRGVSRST